MSVVGTERTWRSSRCMSVIGATADDICSHRVFRLLTQLRQNSDILGVALDRIGGSKRYRLSRHERPWSRRTRRGFTATPRSNVAAEWLLRGTTRGPGLLGRQLF